MQMILPGSGIGRQQPDLIDRQIGLRLARDFSDLVKRCGERLPQRGDFWTQFAGQVDDAAIGGNDAETRALAVLERNKFHEVNPNSWRGLSTSIFCSIAASGTARYKSSSRSASFGGWLVDTGCGQSVAQTTRSGAASIKDCMTGITSSKGGPVLLIFSLSESITQKLPRLSNSSSSARLGSLMPARGSGRAM